MITGHVDEGCTSRPPKSGPPLCMYVHVLLCETRRRKKGGGGGGGSIQTTYDIFRTMINGLLPLLHSMVAVYYMIIRNSSGIHFIPWFLCAGKKDKILGIQKIHSRYYVRHNSDIELTAAHLSSLFLVSITLCDKVLRHASQRWKNSAVSLQQKLHQTLVTSSIISLQ